MTVAADTLFTFDNSFVRELTGLYEPWSPVVAPAPQLLALDEALALELGVDPATLRTPAGVDLLVGNRVPTGAEPVAQAYAGHQFGGYSPRLGDGRALLLGEVLDIRGHRRDLHVKGSGRTPFSRGGDGKAAVGPMLREFLIAAAMHALGIPTARALSVVATGDTVQRDTELPGAVLLRVASSHIRVGTFQYAAALGDVELVRRLADHSIDRHHPDARAAANPYLGLLEAVTESQASLVARWMLVGFIHGVMNTDNVAISGETIDYGPCAFMDAFDPATVFSSIDHAGRYAYGNQPQIAQWNLARFAETLLELLGPSTEDAVEAATEVLQTFPARFERSFNEGMAAKLGLDAAQEPDPATTELADDLLRLMAEGSVDFTSGFRSLSSVLRAEGGSTGTPFGELTGFGSWSDRWLASLRGNRVDRTRAAAGMDRVNPCYVPRNHLVEAALDAAEDGDLQPFEQLLEVVTDPYVQRPGSEHYESPAPPEFGSYQTFCGT